MIEIIVKKTVDGQHIKNKVIIEDEKNIKQLGLLFLPRLAKADLKNGRGMVCILSIEI